MNCDEAREQLVHPFYLHLQFGEVLNASEHDRAAFESLRPPVVDRPKLLKSITRPVGR